MQRKKKIATDFRGQVVMDHLPPRARVESEASLKLRVTVALATAGALVFRNNVGAIKKGARWIVYGLGKGSADLVCMVPPYGRWLCVELKRQKYGLISEDQKKWIDTVRRYGAVAGVVRSPEEALELLAQARLPVVGK